MAWLVTHMWMTLLAVGLSALLLGWSVRGMLLVGKLRRAMVDRDVSITELSQAREEIDSLYAAQRAPAEADTAVTALGPVDDTALHEELKSREGRLAELSAELTRSKAELANLKSSGAKGVALGAGAGAAIGAAAIAAGGSDGAEPPTLLWRNRHLESRVQHLEDTINDLHAQAQRPAAAAVPVVSDLPDDDTAPVSTVEQDKLAWQADYLRQRVGVLEGLVVAAPGAQVQAQTGIVEAVEDDLTPAIGGVVSPGDAGVDEDPQPDPFAPADVNTELEEELASLRWRNRYLEGRLAYYEGDDATEIEDEDIGAVADISELVPDLSDVSEDKGDDTIAAFAAVGAAVTAGASTLLRQDAAEDEPDAGSDDAEVVSGVEAFTEIADAGDTEVEDTQADDIAETPSVMSDVLGALDEADLAADTAEAEMTADDEDGEALPDEAGDTDLAPEIELPVAAEAIVASPVVTAPLDTERPLSLDGPVGGHSDDLTVIGGVGPKIQEVLNELGVYHYDQIAAWNDENVAWVDDHLSFSGRIARERWVEQAQVLAGDS